MNRVITDAEAAEALAAEWPEQRPVSLPERLDDEADLCANEGADDIAELLAEAATELRALAGRVAELERHNKALVARREHDVNDIKKYSVMVGRLEAAAQPFVKLFQEADANRDQPMDGRSSIDAQIAVNDLRRLVYAADDADAALPPTPESKP